MAQRALEAAPVRDEHAEPHVVGHVDAGEHLRRVGELRDDVGPDEARDLEALDARGGERVDHPHLVFGRDAIGLVLEPVAGTHFADVDALAHRHVSQAAEPACSISAVSSR